ncbi:cobalamin adenosyltransferase [Clostridium sartagoforme]|uniref:cobalamin adenosyltransferase n=1 Tax=Clostridium sartagoforme TaxID=84031 RepID=UPI0031E3F443
MMKFITEEYLRDLYKKEPFSTYQLNQGERLTPGAKQYLSDRGIRMSDEVSYNKKANDIKESKTLQIGCKKRLYYKLKSMEAEFLVVSRDVLKDDIILSQNIISLGKKITNIRNFIAGETELEKLICQECTGINSTNFYDDIDDCFEITEFYMQLNKSNEILKLHVLRCKVHELELYLSEFYNEDNLGHDVIKSVNSIINSLSQIICSIVGGKICQRKN